MPRKKKEKVFQLFTTDQTIGWYPIDHFFYAQSVHDKNNRLVEGPVVAHLETHAAMNLQGWGVSVVSEGKDSENPRWEEFDDIPTALRRMADIIEAHNKKVG